MIMIVVNMFVVCCRPMPDIDHLIQEWPPEIEELLKNVGLPPPDLDCDLATYVDIVCSKSNWECAHNHTIR